MKSFILPKGDSGWTIAVDAFAAAFRVEFPDWCVRVDGDDVYFEGDDLDIVGRLKWLGGPSPSIVLERASIDDAVRICLWYRRLVPEAETLVFCDEAYNFAVELTADLKAEEIRRGAGWSP